jgi:hypothetical protein
MVKRTKPFRPAKHRHQQTKEKVTYLAEEKKKLDNLDVTLQTTKQNGIIITVSTKCSTWELTQKFLNDFENTLLKGNNGTES